MRHPPTYCGNHNTQAFSGSCVQSLQLACELTSPVDTETIQQRLFLIRLALGGGVRPLPFEELAARIAESSGHAYDVSALSRMETGKRKVSLEDVQAIAPLDPKGRGPAWLAFGEGLTPAQQRGRRELEATQRHVPPVPPYKPKG
jgi:hypothetical protein